MTLKDGITLRATSKGIQSFFSIIFPTFKSWIPSYASINRWIKRVGLYKLKSPLDQTSDWIALGDTSIGIGTKKVIVILGIRLTEFKKLIAKNQPLRLNDVVPIHMSIVETCNGEVIHRAFQQATTRVSGFYQICIDGGSDIQAGVRLYADEVRTKENRCIYTTYDTPHKIACLLKKRLENNPQFLELASMASKTRQKQQQSKFSHLIPPNQRSKARYMNLDELINWADGMLMVIDMQESIRQQPIVEKLATDNGDTTAALSNEDYKLLLEDFGWVKELRESIRMFMEYALIGAVTRDEVRSHGLHVSSYDNLNKKLYELPLKYEESLQFCGECLDFIEQQTQGLKEGDLLLGTDEVIESLYGKMKVLLNEDAKHGLTSFVLAAAACCGELNEETVKNAFSSIKDKDVQEWSQKNIGRTHTSKRRRCFRAAKKLITGTKKVKTLVCKTVHKVAGYEERIIRVA